MIHALADAARWTWTGGYNIISGPLADIGILGVFGVAFRRFRCHVDGCHRIGLHHVTGTPYVTCRRHHPTVGDKVTAAHIHTAHGRANPTRLQTYTIKHPASSLPPITTDAARRT